MASIVAGAVSTWRASRYHDLSVVNGLAIPVQADIGGQSKPIEPGHRAEFHLHVGTQALWISDQKGKVIESAELPVRAGRDFTIWNILGAAPVYAEAIVYGPEGSPTPPSSTISCGETAITYGQATHVFVDPPKTMQVSDKQTQITRWHVDVAKGGLPTCVGYLANNSHLEQAAKLAERVAESSGFPARDVNIASTVIREAKGLDAALAFTRRAVAAQPDNVELHPDPIRPWRRWPVSGGSSWSNMPSDGNRTRTRPTSAISSPGCKSPWMRCRCSRASCGDSPSMPAHDARTLSIISSSATSSTRSSRGISTNPWCRAKNGTSTSRTSSERSWRREGATKRCARIEADFTAAPLGPRRGAMAVLYARVAGPIGKDRELLFGRISGAVTDQVTTLKVRRASTSPPTPSPRLASRASVKRVKS